MVFYIGQPQHIDQRDNGQQPQWRGSSYPVAGTHTMMVPVAKYIKWILRMALISWQMMTGGTESEMMMGEWGLDEQTYL